MNPARRKTVCNVMRGQISVNNAFQAIVFGHLEMDQKLNARSVLIIVLDVMRIDVFVKNVIVVTT